MCDKALCDTSANLSKNVDKYRYNWGSLLEYLDMSTPSNVSGLLVSTLPKAVDDSLLNKSQIVSPRRPYKTSHNLNQTTRNPSLWRRTVRHPPLKTNFIKPPPKETAGQIAIQATNRPVHKAIYKLQCADNITGFTQQSILGTYKRLAQNFTEGKHANVYETFPEKQILDELKANSMCLQKVKAEVSENEVTKWLQSKKRIRKNLISEKQVIEFAKNMFLSWDTEGKGCFSVDKIVGELVGLGLAIDSKIITSLVKTFKGGKGDTVIKVEEFLKFMRGDKVSMHISEVLRGIVEQRESYLKRAFAKNAASKKSPELPMKSISYKINEKDNAVIEVPLENKAESRKVILHTCNAENEEVALHFVYDKEGNLMEEVAVNQSKEDARHVLQNFEKALKPLPEKRRLASVPRKTIQHPRQNFNKTLEEIHVIQKWWREIEKKAGYKEEVPINIVADFLVLKGIGANRDKAKQLLGSTYKQNKRYVDYTEFKELLYKGVFRNAIKYIYTEVKGQKNEEEKLPEFMQISNYKKKLLMTAFDSTNPQHQQGIQIFHTLRKQHAKATPQAIVNESVSRRSFGPTKRNVQIQAESSDPPSDHMAIMKKYKQLISARPELHEFLVYNG